MNLRQNQKGFTIVELLIVVVVIAILAAISIVAYTGITNRANRSAAMEAANAVKSVVTTYNGANGAYPSTKAQMVSGGSDPIAKLPCDIQFLAAAPTSAPSNPKSVFVQSHTNGGAVTGYTITYWEYTPAAINTMTVGTLGGTTAILGNACT
jgi:prepilin-type N-terminal cleavage/methylation domain-containing protein